jgi:hypothetical protein
MFQPKSIKAFLSYRTETKFKMAATAAILDEQHCWLSKETFLEYLVANAHKQFQVDPSNHSQVN